ncbi:MAG: hypothetical protein NTX22_07965 [Ignavibacteriales bacterium]|nr:hypothetical protein [Ignavibacteriales bacterium]
MEEIKKAIEQIFRESTSSNELFDTLQKALQLKLHDAQTYKILLGNIVLTTDEVKLFTEKLCEEFPDLSSELFMWTGSILESDPTTDNLDSAFEYYKKAIQVNPQEHFSYLAILKMYNNDLDFPPRIHIEPLCEKGLLEVNSKSKLCVAIADFYDKIEEPALKKKYLTLSAIFAKKEK